MPKPDHQPKDTSNPTHCIHLIHAEFAEQDLTGSVLSLIMLRNLLHQHGIAPHNMLILRLVCDLSRIPWVQVHEGVVRAQGVDSLAHLGTTYATERCIVLVSGQAVWLTGVEVPPRLGRATQQAIPYLLEEQLAEEVEALHFVTGPRTPDGELMVAVVAKAQIVQWLSQLAEAGLKPHALLPESALLFDGALAQQASALPPPFPAAVNPVMPKASWQLWLDAEQAFLLAANRWIVACARDEAAFFVELRWREHESADLPDPLMVFHAAGSATIALPAEIPQDTQELKTSLLGLFAQRLAQPAPPLPFNLLAGPYSRQDSWQRYLAPWRVAAGVLAAWLALQFVSLGVEIQQLERESGRRDQQMQALYQEVFGPGPVGDPRRQMESALLGLRSTQAAGSGDFDVLLAGVTPALLATQGLSIQALRYRPGQIDLDLLLPNLRALDTLKQHLEQAETAMRLEVQSATALEGRAEARIILRKR